MKPYPDENSICRNIQAQLCGYMDNTLSARQVWEVEKHLTECADCATFSHQMQATVQLLHTAERYDTGDDFMAKLHARLDGLEPEPSHAPSFLAAVWDWLAEVRATLQARRVPALGLSMAMAALVGLFLFGRSTGVYMPAPSSTPAPMSAEPLRRNVALAASNPFDDPVAADLEANSALTDTVAAQSTE